MSIAYNPKIVTDGLVLHLDAENIKSYPVTSTTWFDMSKNSNHATQSTAGSRPIRSTAPITGVRNLLDRTEEFDNAYWTKIRGSVTANATTSPFGDLTADKWVENSETGDHDIRRERSYTSGQVVFISMFFKKAERKFGTISTFGTGLGLRGAVIDLDDGTVQNMGGAYGAFTSVSSESFGNGWYRLTVVTSSPATGNGTIAFAMTTTATGTPSYTGDGSSGLFMFGAHSQIGELGNTPYQHRITQHEVYEAGVPNRVYLFYDGINDFIEVSQPAVSFSPNRWTICIFMNPNNQFSRFLTPNSHGLDQFLMYNNTHQRIDIRIAQSADVNERTRQGENGTVPIGQWTYSCISIDNLNIKIYVNGNLTNEYNEEISIANWASTWRIGQRGNSTNWYSGLMSIIKVYNRALTSEEIKQNYNAIKGRYGI